MDIKTLRVELEKSEARTVALRKGLEALQLVCAHDWEDSGHDSHHSYQRCKVCGFEEKT